MKCVALRRWCVIMVIISTLLTVTGCTDESASSSSSSTSVSSLKVTVPNYYLPGMVFQRGKPIRLHGMVQGTSKSEAVKLTARFVYGSKRYESSIQAKIGKQFDLSIANVPTHADAYTLTFLLEGQVKRTIRNVYVGDVFVMAGQSNMELNYAEYYESEAGFTANVQNLFVRSDLPKYADDEGIRFLVVDRKTGGTSLPLKSFNTDKWLPATAGNTKRLGYLPQLFAEQLRERHPNVPVGIIQTAWGGTDIARHLKDGDIYANHIEPLKGYGMAGILWYQGENDTAEQAPALQYETHFATLINQYRAVFGDPDLPFLYVQLARYTGYAYTPIVRQAQFDVLDSSALHSTKNLAMTVSMDTDKGTAKLIHPLGKEILAKRMADQWLAMVEKAAVPSGPQATKATPVDGDASTVTISFRKGTATGLQALEPNYTRTATLATLTSPTATPLQGFEVAGIDGIFHSATASIQGNTVIVHSVEVLPISQVRYLWSGAPTSQSMLYNSRSLPAVPFLLATRMSSVLYRNR